MFRRGLHLPVGVFLLSWVLPPALTRVRPVERQRQTPDQPSDRAKSQTRRLYDSAPLKPEGWILKRAVVCPLVRGTWITLMFARNPSGMPAAVDRHMSTEPDDWKAGRPVMVTWRWEPGSAW